MARRILISVVAALAVTMMICARGEAGPADCLWYQQPAQKWTEALPIGNGRMGAMVFGGVPDERIQFNEDTLWTGHPHDYVRSGAKASLPEIRNLLFEGKTAEAEKFVRSSFLSDPVRQKAYQPFGDLRFHFDGISKVTDYRRELDLDTAVAGFSYRADGMLYRREVFASFPSQIIVVRVTADQPGKLNFTVKMDGPHTNSVAGMAAPNTLVLKGEVEAGGLRFESRARVLNTGGQLHRKEHEILVTNADSVTILLAAATSFNNFADISGDPESRCTQTLSQVVKQSYEELLAAHLKDYRGLYRRVALDLGATDSAKLATDQRFQRVKQSGLESDPAFASLYFQYGRYLLISSSRPGSQPANLQGVWNEELNPPWESKWTLNINCEMNYWPVEVCNLGECAQPLFSMMDDLAVSGARTASEQYGCGGWVVHHNTDLWRGTAPINNIDGVWPTGGAWLCQHLWDHYLFTGDRDFLEKSAYPAMKGAALFFVDSLVKDPTTGYLVTCPSFSPEQGTLCAGPAMDMQLIRALFDSTVQAAKILGTDSEFIAQVEKIEAQLAPDKI